MTEQVNELVRKARLLTNSPALSTQERESILTRLASQAFRRPVPPEVVEVVAAVFLEPIQGEPRERAPIPLGCGRGADVDAVRTRRDRCPR